jgi:hypothetical protein
MGKILCESGRFTSTSKERSERNYMTLLTPIKLGCLGENKLENLL